MYSVALATIIPHLILTPQPFIGVSASQSALLYCIMCPVGPYFKKGKDDPSSVFSPVSLYADPKYIRAWPGGVGDTKVGGYVDVYVPQIKHLCVATVCMSVCCMLTRVLLLFGCLCCV